MQLPENASLIPGSVGVVGKVTCFLQHGSCEVGRVLGPVLLVGGVLVLLYI